MPMRKIIHIDMDCFYAAIESRDDLSIVDKPVGVGGTGTHEKRQLELFAQ